ncbi:MAG: RNA methyltransferase [Marinilabiliales bacterium]|nr:MAG: RNA methyltransferase [Marinilabiliales bacterium]
MSGLPGLKFISSLKHKKYRRLHNLFVAEGEKMVDDLLKSSLHTEAVYATGQWFAERDIEPDGGKHDQVEAGSRWLVGKDKVPGGTESEVRGKAFRSGCPFYRITEKELQRISSLTTPNKVLALVRIPSYSEDHEKMKNSLTLILDRIRDPGNLGTLVRSADWFGVDTLVLSEDSAEMTSPKTVQSTMGSLFRIRYHYVHLPSFLASPRFSGVPVYGASSGGSSVWSHPLSKAGFLVLGNESQGISPEVEKLVTHKIGIPRGRPRGQTESLNIAAAGSIIMAEFSRRMFDGT